MKKLSLLFTLFCLLVLVDTAAQTRTTVILKKSIGAINSINCSYKKTVDDDSQKTTYMVVVSTNVYLQGDLTTVGAIIFSDQQQIDDFTENLNLAINEANNRSSDTWKKGRFEVKPVYGINWIYIHGIPTSYGFSSYATINKNRAKKLHKWMTSFKIGEER